MRLFHILALTSIWATLHVHEMLAKVQMDFPRTGTSPALKRAHKALQKGRKLIAKQQKLVRIVDHSKLGWSTVIEHDNEKSLEKAERTVERKVASKAKEKACTTDNLETGHWRWWAIASKILCSL